MKCITLSSLYYQIKLPLDVEILLPADDPVCLLSMYVEEMELSDPEAYVKEKFQGKEVTYDKTVLEDGTIIFDILTSGIKQRCSFTEI